MTFTFTILHYKTFDDTKACIDSILALDDKANIVVIDNGSNNGSFEKIKELYQDNDIHFIDNNVNLGFAAANNIAYKYAKNELKSDYIAISNNDIKIINKDFIKKVIARYKEKKCSLIGPKIIGIDNINQNPMMAEEYTKAQLIKKIIMYKIALFLCNCGFSKYFINKSKKLVDNAKIDINNYQLQGPFIIYCKDYIDKEEFAFYPGTFLYCEEAILYNYCKRNNYTMDYYDEIEVFHKTSSSTKTICVSEKTKYIFILKHSTNSLIVLYKYLYKQTRGN